MGKRSFAARLQQLFSAHDMTLGAPWKRILEFAIPMLIGNLAQQLYNTADSIIVGRYVGDNALAAVGSASPILNLLLALFVGVSTGVGILVAQRYGAKDREQLSVVIGNCITLSAIVSVITMIIGALITRPMLELLSTPASIIDWCADYLMIYFLGIAGFAYYNILSGVLRGMGDSLSALGFLLVAAALNVGLDLWFVAGLGLGGWGSGHCAGANDFRFPLPVETAAHAGRVRPDAALLETLLRAHCQYHPHRCAFRHHSGHLLRGHACGPVPHQQLW